MMASHATPPVLSIVMPVLNEADGIAVALAHLQPLRARGVELIVVDGGSDDGTVAMVQNLADRVIDHRRGRATQMNAGAAVARANVLLFLHADTAPPPDVDRLVRAAVADRAAAWGRFDISIAGSRAMLGVIGWFMNQRSRLTGISTGDQGLFITRALFDQVGGFPEQPLMEDVEITSRLRRIAKPICLGARMVTSGRRWEQHGVWRTIWLMWRLRWQYSRGADPSQLHQLYYGN
jgi:rSAM/selenodomain-associated transferase 2